MKSYAKLRAFNAVLSAVIVVLFFVHAIGNGLQFFIQHSVLPMILADLLIGGVLVHTIIGIILTVQSVKTVRQAGANYASLNKRFWVVRISGLVLMVLILLHVLRFSPLGGPFYLKPYSSFELVVSILLVITLAVHIVANLQPMMISLGIATPKKPAVVFGLVAIAILVFAAAGFVAYFQIAGVL